MGGGLFVYLHKYVRVPSSHSKVKQEFVMSVLFDSMALRYVQRRALRALSFSILGLIYHTKR